MHRFFSTNTNLHDKVVAITDRDEIHHMQHVLRLKKGDPVCIFNGSGEEAMGNILKLRNAQIDVKLKSLSKITHNRKAPITLACAIPKNAKFEFIIEKCTELGVDEIIPLKTKRTEVILNKERSEKKTIRYQKKAINAAKQCKRTTVPVIHPVSNFTEIVQSLSNHDIAFIPCLTGNRKNLDQVLKIKKNHKKIIFFIGPEGDFTPQELSLAMDAGCIPVSLGPYTLKVDTAAISVIALTNLLMTHD